jgi:nicotinate-nucleotide adenylyltransferase
MIITEEMLSRLREDVRPYLTEKRYGHTLAVEEESKHLADILLCGADKDELTGEIRAASLLHDVTKKEDLEKQLHYCTVFGIMTRDDFSESPKLFHAVTASELIKRDFPEFASETVVDCVRWHTTGHDGMTLHEAIVYLADYIEATRTFEDCVKLREYFYGGIAGDSLKGHFIRTMILSFDYTIKNLCAEGSPIDADTVGARNFFITLLRHGAGNYFGDLQR